MSETNPTTAPSEPDAVQRASHVFEAWLLRKERGSGEPFDELVAQNPDLKGSLERLARMDAFLRDAIHQALPEPISERTRAKMLGDYRIVKEIGRGAMGIVFEAEQVSLHRRVAIKVLPAHLTLNERALARFQREAEITARLNHRNIINVHQVAEVAGVHFISMELVEGTSLDRVIERMRRESFEGVGKKKIGDVVSVHGLDDGKHALPETAAASAPARERPGSAGSKKGSSSASNKNYIETAVKLVCQVADALDHAHQAGVIHRDVKPSNILVRPDGSPVLTDFGLAREDGLPTVSQTGDFAGTPNFVSPEQAMSGRLPVDNRSDVFSLGATLYELLTLEPAFPGETIHEILGKIISKQPRDPQKLNPALAPDLVTIVFKSLEKDPDRRYQSAAELAEDLRSFVEYRPIKARRTPTMVRAWRWAKREPLKAGLVAVLAFGIPLTAALGGRLLSLAGEVEELAPKRREGQLKQGYLAIGTGRHAEAEGTFRALLEDEPASLEAITGVTLALLNQKRADDALLFLQDTERELGRLAVLERLRADALRAADRDSEAAGVEADIPVPDSPLELYVEGLRLLRGSTCAAEPSADQRERAARACELLHGAAFRDTERASYKFALAWAAWVAGRADMARLADLSIRDKWSGEAMAWYYVGIAREVFDEAGAREAYARALELDPTLADAAQRSAALALASDPGGTAEEFERLATVNPERADFWNNLAVARVRAGRYEEALEAATRATEVDDELVEAHGARGEALYRLDRLEEACAAYRRAIELDPGNARYHSGLGVTLWKLHENDQSAEALDEALRLDPGDANALCIRAEIHSSREEFDAAIELLEDALESQVHLDAPSLAGAYELLGRCYSEVERKDEAIAPLQRALELKPCKEDVHLFLVENLQRLGRKQEALDAAIRWTKAYRDSAQAWNHRAWLRVDPDGDPALRDDADGLDAAEEAVELSREQDPGILDTYAWALFRNGRVDESVETSSRALELAERSDMTDEDRENLAKSADRLLDAASK